MESVSVPCTAQPLILYLLDLNLARQVDTSRQANLNKILDAMQVYRSRYENADLVVQTAHRISTHAQSLSGHPKIMCWGDILCQTPKTYLQFMATMDAALAKGSCPTEKDLPSEFEPYRHCIVQEKLDIGNSIQEKTVDDNVAYLKLAETSHISQSVCDMSSVLSCIREEHWDNMEDEGRKFKEGSDNFGPQEALLMESDILLLGLSNWCHS